MDGTMTKHLRILGTRGIPACHGGFETFAEHLAIYLTEAGWNVTVYCQEDGDGDLYEDTWKGIRLMHIPVQQKGAMGTILFDWKSILHACKESGLVLTLGYNTAVFSALYRLRGIRNLINMDGIEWRRKKWSRGAKLWLYLNEWAGAHLGHHLIADHPQIKNHLLRHVHAGKISTIAYGAPCIESASADVLKQFGLEPSNYAIMIARPEPENSVLEVVRAWSAKKQGMPLVVLGKYSPEVPLQREVLNTASDEVMFLGAIYDKSKLAALRFFARVYIHGHQVGGTNPSLVEALGAGNAIIAHDNKFNRWVAGDRARYFDSSEALATVLEQTVHDSHEIEQMRLESAKRHQEQFTWPRVLLAYEALFLSMLVPVPSRSLPVREAAVGER
jgi:glycosyltransferase involved in cell wall biosynthesis